ncbi:peptidase M23 [Microbacterium sp. bgisy203]|uniref:peptidase M23 n=1 Tax=Microbacterium sp. bgisy203 TaxID=3413799 RepID=UPI003D752AEC
MARAASTSARARSHTRAGTRTRTRHRPSQRQRRRRIVAAALAIAVMPILAVTLIAVNAYIATTTAPPAIEKWDDQQRANAALIIAAGRDLGLSPRDQAIAVMTAMGESSLRNIDYGDWETSGVTNPDGSRTTSIGLFQQQDAWGTRDQRLDPYAAATLFYRAMTARVPDRDQRAPTTVAHLTQINRNPDHYARYWEDAVVMLESLTGEDVGSSG